MINQLPVLLYSLTYFISALLIYHSHKPSFIATVIIISALIIWSIYFLFNKYKKNIASIIFSFHAIKNNQLIDSFSLPSSVIYRVRKSYDISPEDIIKAEKDIKNYFKNKLDTLLYGTKESSFEISPMSYIFWNEFFKSGKIYQDFCMNTIGYFVCPPLQEIRTTENKLPKLSASLKMI